MTRLSRFAPLSGVIAVVLVIISFAVGGETPDVGDSQAQITSFYDSNEASQAVAILLFVLAAFFLVIFGAMLYTTLRSRFEDAWLSAGVAGAGSIITAVGLLVTAAIAFASIDGADNDISGEALESLNTLSNASWVMWVPGIGTMLLGAAFPLMREARVLRVLGWIALILGICCFIPFVAFFAFLASGIWSAVTSVVLYMARAADTAAGRPAVARSSPPAGS